jgi:hypothetical protein
MASWIFQGNPKRFKVNEYLRKNKTIIWSINQKRFEDEISIGDEVYIWRSDGREPKSGGIVAKGEIISTPKVMKDDKPELWLDANKKDAESKLRVRIRLEDVRLNDIEGMIKRVELEQNPVLKEIRILKFHNNTNYKLSPTQAQYVRKLWKQKRSTPFT